MPWVAPAVQRGVGLVVPIFAHTSCMPKSSTKKVINIADSFFNPNFSAIVLIHLWFICTSYWPSGCWCQILLLRVVQISDHPPHHPAPLWTACASWRHVKGTLSVPRTLLSAWQWSGLFPSLANTLMSVIQIHSVTEWRHTHYRFLPHLVDK